MTTRELYKRLREQAVAERGSSQVWHEADIEGHHLYMGDTSFGDGPLFSYDGHGWQIAYGDVPITRGTTPEHLAEALSFAERAEWRSRFESMLPEHGSTPSKAFSVGVKGLDGDWATLTALELRVTEPITLKADTAGVLSIIRRERPATEMPAAPEDPA